MHANSLGMVRSVACSAAGRVTKGNPAPGRAKRRPDIIRRRAACTLCASLFVVVGLLLSVRAQSPFGTMYQVTDLGTLGGATTVANYINNRGEIVGASRTSTGFQHAFLYSDGVMQDLGTLGGNESSGNIVNDLSEVGGAADRPDGSRHGFLYDKGVTYDLGGLPNSTFSTAFGLNNRGQLLGGSRLPGTSIFHAVTFSADGVVDLGTLGGPSSFGVHISDEGEATGRADLGNGFSRAFLYTGGVLYDVGLLPGDTVSFGRSLNNRGELVAQSCGVSGCRGFLWRNGEMIELGSLGGTQTNPLSINDRGQVVGGSRTATGGTTSHAFLWVDGMMLDLNDSIPPGSGWVLVQANGVNASGQIVGNGTLNGQARGFLLTPQPRRVPEQSTP